MIRRFLNNYLPRHTNRINQALHMVGVPLTFVAAPWTAVAGVEWFYPISCFFGGYLLQFAGHVVEGNDAGEVVFIKKTLGMPYTEYAPGKGPSSPAAESADTSTAD